MTKYQINYNRVAPDHRVPFDYKFLQKINGPLDYFKVSLILFSTGNKVLTPHGSSTTLFT